MVVRIYVGWMCLDPSIHLTPPSLLSLSLSLSLSCSGFVWVWLRQTDGNQTALAKLEAFPWRCAPRKTRNGRNAKQLRLINYDRSIYRTDWSFLENRWPPNEPFAQNSDSVKRKWKISPPSEKGRRDSIPLKLRTISVRFADLIQFIRLIFVPSHHPEYLL